MVFTYMETVNIYIYKYTSVKFDKIYRIRIYTHIIVHFHMVIIFICIGISNLLSTLQSSMVLIIYRHTQSHARVRLCSRILTDRLIIMDER